ncbi:hypothetical protein [Paractinoplanes hotanensis]|uniref:Uncharacterized protein n=1 Tax=Paractinoplanes hotanensis TaxID=2906497 RepID=A0ABT0XXJ5_9ACTN|nr:hypothetical protein [Actinoplanes hotanensis]MCM4077973.1 hypothetical protein [Actinoplanes hotanensis]
MQTRTDDVTTRSTASGDRDDAGLVRSRVGRTHPFSAEPFRPDRKRRRRRGR